MKWKRALGAAAGVLLLAGGLLAMGRLAQRQTPAEQLEGALGEAWDRQSKTETFHTEFADGQGHKITQYIIRTTFYGQERGQEGAKLAMEQIVGPDAAEDSRACQVNGCQAMVYQIKEKGYLCWTLSPEYSIVLEYDWAGASDAEILQMGESIQLVPKPPGGNQS